MASETMIKIRDLTFEYFDRDEDGNLTDMINAIRGINFDANKGEFIAIAGRNGSGKSTLARILNRLLVPVEGTVVISNLDAMDEDNETTIRKKVGMVFQNPDDQIIGSVVAEDVAFGAENVSVPQNELWDRVNTAIERAGLAVNGETVKSVAKKRINDLSGGEKQKVAIAGVLAMEPECIVLDEATSMLDSKSRWEILSLMKELREKLGVTIIMITHMMDELLLADKIFIMNQGRIVMKGRKEAIFSKPDELEQYGLEIPKIVRIREQLCRDRVINDNTIFSVDGIVNRLKTQYPMTFEKNITLPENAKTGRRIDPVNAILLDKVSFSYGNKKVLRNISLAVGKGEYVSIVGPTGSGKSTMLQLIPALQRCRDGNVYVDGIDVNDRTTDITGLRCKIGYVFQYPEQQLFAKNVFEDVVFGPRNVGISEVEAEKRAYESIALVGLPDDVYDMPLNKLSGGQRRRVALAGVLAMKPEYLILDEPVAGLDPEGRREMLDIIDTLHKDVGMTIIMVSHDIESVAKYSDRVVVLNQGEVAYNGAPANAFFEIVSEALKHKKDINNVPVMMQLLVKLRAAGLPVDCVTCDMNQGIANIKAALGWHYNKPTQN